LNRHAVWASHPAATRGRQHLEPMGETRGPRTAFQRDRDRIIHSIAFRRLRHKTQVFVAPDGDHFRVRLTHSLEVAQIGRTIARALGLDEDLTEALCLAHDIGHPPFGHAGEDALQAALAGMGGFDHNGHTLRVLTELECPYPLWRGLNLSWEALEGLAKHNGPVLKPEWALQAADAAFRLDLQSHASLEAQVAAIADDIAYDNHDIDDGLRAGLLSFDELIAEPFVADTWTRVRKRYPDIPVPRLRAELIRQQIGIMVNDVITASRDAIREAGVGSVEDVRAVGRPLIRFSETVRDGERDLKTFMYRKLYHHPRQVAVADQARVVVAGLFALYRDNPASMPEEWRETLPAAEPSRSRHIADFIAGMTDRYALDRYREVIGPIDMPEGF
jgi:dGTPase